MLHRIITEDNEFDGIAWDGVITNSVISESTSRNNAAAGLSFDIDPEGNLIVDSFFVGNGSVCDLETCDVLTLSVTPTTACPGDSITFTVTGACTPTNCEAVLDWTISSTTTEVLPTPLTGSFNCPGGTMDVTLTLPEDTPGGPITFNLAGQTGKGVVCPADSATVILPNDYEPVAITYRTFIRCGFVEASWPSPTWPFYSGDNRVFNQAGSSRTLQSCNMKVDPVFLTGLIGTPLQQTGVSNGYFTLNETPPPYGEWCDFLCRFRAQDGQQPACSQPGPSDLEVVPKRVSKSEVKVLFHVFARPGCSTPLITPSIDSNVNVHIRQTCTNGVLDPAEYRIVGSTDGFPWHEIFVNGEPTILVDPCLFGTSPLELLPPDDEVSINADWRPVPTGP